MWIFLDCEGSRMPAQDEYRLPCTAAGDNPNHTGSRSASCICIYEGRERNGGELDLLGRHFSQLWDRDFDRVRYPLEVGRVGSPRPIRRNACC
jgi:hypothetical protein